MKKAIITILLLSPFIVLSQTKVIGNGSVTYNNIDIPDPALSVTEFENEYITGASYYNRGVLLLEKSTENKSEIKLSEVVKPVIDVFGMSEQHLLKAHKLNPSDKATIEMLSSVYFILNKENEYKAFNAKADKL